MPRVVRKLGLLVQFKGEEPNKARHGCGQSCLLNDWPSVVIRYTVFSELGDSDRGNHPGVDNPHVQFHTERPLSSGPMDLEDAFQDAENPLKRPSFAHEPGE